MHERRSNTLAIQCLRMLVEKRFGEVIKKESLYQSKAILKRWVAQRFSPAIGNLLIFPDKKTHRNVIKSPKVDSLPHLITFAFKQIALQEDNPGKSEGVQENGLAVA